jgi:hypothetical protein
VSSLLDLEVKNEGADASALLAAAMVQIERLPDELAKQWGPKLVQWQQENIDRSQSPDGRPFLPLSPVTIARRTQDALSAHRAGGRQERRSRFSHPYGTKPLIDTTAMYATMKWEFPGPGEVSGGATARTSRGFAYPVAQQEGTGRIPARPWSGLRAENLVELEGDTVAGVIRAIQRASSGG